MVHFRPEYSPISAKPGQLARYDYEYSWRGTCNIFMANEPLVGKRMVRITSTRKRHDWARFLEEIANQYKHAERITLVLDNLNTHELGLLYHAFKPKKAKALLDRFEFVIYAKAWKLAEYGRDRIESLVNSMSESPY